MKRLLAALTLGAFLLTACTGTFTLTKKVHKFNRDFKDKWVEEVVFLAFVILPVYGVATLGDALIFNSLEFWTGDNPMAANEQAVPSIAYDPLLNRVVIHSGDLQTIKLTLEQSGEELLARHADGTVLYRMVPAEDGSLAIFNANGRLLQQLTAEQIATLRDRVAG